MTNCWTSTSCVNRCDGQWRGDYACQCDSDCIRRGDCCPDRDLSCRATLPVKLEYWPTSSTDCGTLPDFDKLPQAVTEKKIAQMRFESTEDEPNLFGIGIFSKEKVIFYGNHLLLSKSKIIIRDNFGLSVK